MIKINTSDIKREKLYRSNRKTFSEGAATFAAIAMLGFIIWIIATFGVDKY